MTITHPPVRGRSKPAGDEARRMGPLPASALVVGSIVGVGIFSLPYSLASYGPISLVAMGIASLGAVALALVRCMTCPIFREA